MASPTVLAASPPLSPDQAKILQSVTACALRYTQKLPDFMCTRITHRQISSLINAAGEPTGVTGLGALAVALPDITRSTSTLRDVIEERLTFIDHKENYTVIAVNGRKVTGVDHIQFQGAISTGEFGTDLHNIFDPRSSTVFSWDRPGAFPGSRIYIYLFRVPAQHGAVVVDLDSGSQVVASCAGRIFVEAVTLAVLRIEYHFDLPQGFPIRDAAVIVDYRPIAIAGRRYILPFRADVRMRDHSRQYVSTIDFRDYHKFVVESTVVYGAQSPQ